MVKIFIEIDSTEQKNNFVYFELISRAFAVGNNYLGLINFKVKNYRQKLFFINEDDVECSFFLNIQHHVHS